MKTIRLQLHEALLLNPARSLLEVEQRSQFLLAVKYFELGELSSGQAARMCGLSRAAFLLQAGQTGAVVAELDSREFESEFAHQ